MVVARTAFLACLPACACPPACLPACLLVFRVGALQVHVGVCLASACLRACPLVCLLCLPPPPPRNLLPGHMEIPPLQPPALPDHLSPLLLLPPAPPAPAPQATWSRWWTQRAPPGLPAPLGEGACAAPPQSSSRARWQMAPGTTPRSLGTTSEWGRLGAGSCGWDWACLGCSPVCPHVSSAVHLGLS